MGEQAAHRRGSRSIGANQLLFVGILAVLGAQGMAKEEYKVEAYDCSQPTNIKMYDRSAHCKFDPAVEGIPEKFQ